MKNFEIWYYRHNNYITTKIIKANDIKEAIKKSKVKTVFDIKEIIER